MAKLFSWLRSLLRWGKITLSITTVFSSATQLPGAEGDISSEETMEQAKEKINRSLEQAKKARNNQAFESANRHCKEAEQVLVNHQAHISPDFEEISKEVQKERETIDSR